MRPNMKKSIIMTIIYCMGIGGLTLFIGTLYPGNKSDGIAEAINSDKELLISSVDAGSEQDNSENDKSPSASTPTATATPTPTPQPTPTPEPTPSPTPLPVYEVTVGGYPEIQQFFHDYYVAWNSSDHEQLKAKSTDPDKVVSLKALERETQFIDDIRDIQYYIIKSYEEKAYVVYVYYEIKYVNIKTTLPRLDKFYLVTDKDGNLMINNSDKDEVLQSYLDDRDRDNYIAYVIETTNDKAKQALEKDNDLRVYVEALYRR